MVLFPLYLGTYMPISNKLPLTEKDKRSHLQARGEVINNERARDTHTPNSVHIILQLCNQNSLCNGTFKELHPENGKIHTKTIERITYLLAFWRVAGHNTPCETPCHRSHRRASHPEESTQTHKTCQAHKKPSRLNPHYYHATTFGSETVSTSRFLTLQRMSKWHTAETGRGHQFEKEKNLQHSSPESDRNCMFCIQCIAIAEPWHLQSNQPRTSDMMDGLWGEMLEQKRRQRERVFRARSIKRATLPNPLTLAGNTKALAETLQDKC